MEPQFFIRQLFRRQALRFLKRIDRRMSLPENIPANQIRNEQLRQYPEQGHPTEVLILGIFSIACCGLLTGIPAWIIGSRELQKIDKNLISPQSRSETKAGMILGILGTAASILFMLLILGVVVVSVLYKEAVDVNRGAVIRDLHTLATAAQEYYKRPPSLGGGSYKGYKIPRSLSANSNGYYSAAVYDQEVIITGRGIQKGHGGNFILHEILITPDTIFTRRLN
jgi:hypothetical protein